MLASDWNHHKFRKTEELCPIPRKAPAAHNLCIYMEIDLAGSLSVCVCVCVFPYLPASALFIGHAIWNGGLTRNLASMALPM